MEKWGRFVRNSPEKLETFYETSVITSENVIKMKYEKISWEYFGKHLMKFW